jgi:hypothetical protein
MSTGPARIVARRDHVPTRQRRSRSNGCASRCHELGFTPMLTREGATNAVMLHRREKARRSPLGPWVICPHHTAGLVSSAVTSSQILTINEWVLASDVSTVLTPISSIRNNYPSLMATRFVGRVCGLSQIDVCLAALGVLRGRAMHPARTGGCSELGAGTLTTCRGGGGGRRLRSALKGGAYVLRVC